MALLLALIALAFLARALEATDQPAPTAVYAVEPIPVATQTVVISTTSDGISQSTAVVQSGDGMTIVSSVSTTTTDATPDNISSDPNAQPNVDNAPNVNRAPDANSAPDVMTNPDVRTVSSTSSGPDATTGSTTYNTISSVKPVN